MLKRFPVHITSHTSVQAVADLRREHGYASDDVAAIHIAGNPKMATINNIPEPADLMMSQYSLPFCVALAHYKEPRDPRSFSAATFNDPAIRSLARRVTITVSDEAKHGHTLASTVTVTLKDGRALTKRVDDFKGTPELAARPRRDAGEIPAADAALRATRHGAAVRAHPASRGRAHARLDEGCGQAQQRAATQSEAQDMTAELTTRVLAADDDAIAEAAHCLGAGGLVAFPTETVYGLGADATDGKAVARLYAAKGRPAFNPLIAHVPDIAAARALAAFNEAAEQLAAAFWPGPLTLVLNKRPNCPVADLATAGLDSIAIRVPDHPVARGLLARARQAGGGAVRQPLRPCLADRRGACAQRLARPNRHDPRWRADVGRHRIHHRRLP